jgi:hypothetical protein
LYWHYSNGTEFARILHVEGKAAYMVRTYLANAVDAKWLMQIDKFQTPHCQILQEKALLVSPKCPFVWRRKLEASATLSEFAGALKCATISV